MYPAHRSVYRLQDWQQHRQRLLRRTLNLYGILSRDIVREMVYRNRGTYSAAVFLLRAERFHNLSEKVRAFAV